MAGYLLPQWPAPANVKAIITTRQGGSSIGPYASFNLASHVGDNPDHVALNRHKLIADWKLRESPAWLEQVHSAVVVNLDDGYSEIPIADAAVTTCPERPCVVLTADCLPILLCDIEGQVVGAAHAGWRGLAGGIVRNTVAAMARPGTQLLAYLGPAIGPAAFEVGEEVRDSFMAQAMGADHARTMPHCFKPGAGEGKLLADLYGLARLELNQLGVTAVYGGDYCTFADGDRFYSYRRDQVAGRMASVIWLEELAQS